MGGVWRSTLAQGQCGQPNQGSRAQQWCVWNVTSVLKTVEYSCQIGAFLSTVERGSSGTMRAELIGHFEPCMTDIYLHIYARMADYIRTHP